MEKESIVGRQAPGSWYCTFTRCPHFAAAAIVLMLGASIGMAGTIRHDVPDSDYLALGNDSTYESVGALLFDEGGGSFICSGSMIHPEYVLTAGHCGAGNDLQGGGITNMRFFLGPDLSGIPVTVDQIVVNPGFTGSVSGGNDLSLLHLSSPITAVTPAQLYRGADEKDSVATHVGYGASGTGQSGAVTNPGTKRAGRNTIDNFGGEVGDRPVGPGILLPAPSHVMYDDFDNPDKFKDSQMGSSDALPLEYLIAGGDSGGGAFIDIGGITFLAGVHSFILSRDGAVGSDSDYGDMGGSIRVGQFDTWIDANANITVFWNGAAGDWDDDAAWSGGPEPAATNAAVVNGGSINVTQPGEQTEYLFVQDNAQLNINSGSLSAPQIILKTGGTISFTGGRLESVSIDGDLQNDGGTFAPGQSPAFSTISGDYTSNAGILEIEIGGLTPGTQHDQLDVTGDASLAGTLDVQLINGFMPGFGDAFTILTANNVLGTFDTELLPVLGNGLDWAVAYNPTSVVLGVINALLLGDANKDGQVTGADLISVQQNFGDVGSTPLQGDANNDGQVTGADLISVQQNFGNVLAPASSSVPEPATAALLGLAGMLMAGYRTGSGRV